MATSSRSGAGFVPSRVQARTAAPHRSHRLLGQDLVPLARLLRQREGRRDVDLRLTARRFEQLHRQGGSIRVLGPDGDRVEPEIGVFYYRNRPVDYRETVAFPPGLRMVAGGTFPRAYWTCDGESDAALESRKRSIPDCGDDGQIKLHVFFPSCWDGKNLDSFDHRRHVVYGVDADGHPADIDAERCPSTHPVKIPELDLRVQYDVEDGRDYRLSDGRVTPHADFFNAWSQSDLERLVHRCLGRVGTSCGLIDDA